MQKLATLAFALAVVAVFGVAHACARSRTHDAAAVAIVVDDGGHALIAPAPTPDVLHASLAAAPTVSCALCLGALPAPSAGVATRAPKTPRYLLRLALLL
jgi:hypothetical protein